MAYTANVPNSADLISSTQPIILGNFQQLPVDFGVDHYTFGQDYPESAPYDVAITGDDGKHKQLTLVRASADIANTGTEQLAIFNKTATNPAKQELFLRRESGGTVIQLTAGDVVVAGDGTSFLPGGLLIQWGKLNVASTAGGEAGPVTFPTAFGAEPYSIQLTLQTANPGSNDSGVFVSDGTNPTATTFHYRTQRAGTLHWMAIGLSKT